MQVKAVNGFSRVNVAPANGPSNGFSRVNYSGNVQEVNDLELNALMLNALNEITLNAIDDMTDDEFEDFIALVEYGDAMDETEMNGLFSRIKEGVQKRRARRKERRAARRERRSKRRDIKDTRLEARLERLKGKAAEGGKGLLSKLAETGMSLGEKFLEGKMGQADEFLDDVGDDYDLQIEDPESVANMQEKGYLFGKPPFEPWTGRWWQSGRVPVIQKVGVGAAGLIAVDLISGGKIGIAKKIGLKK